MRFRKKGSAEMKRPSLARILKMLLAGVLTVGVGLGLYNVIKSTYLDRQISKFLPSAWVNLDEEIPSASAAADHESEGVPVFRIGIAPIVSPEKSLETYRDLINYIADKLERRPVSLYRPTYSETSDLVRYRRCDIAVICTYPFIRGEREFGMEALVVPRIKGEITYQSFIVVRRESPAESLLDLRRKRFGSADIISTTGWLYPAMILMERGEDPKHFFGEHIITGSHDRSVQALIDGFVDGVAVHGVVYDQMLSEDPSIGEKTRILSKSPPFGIQPLVVHPDLDPELKKVLRTILVKMDDDPKGKPILEKMGIERFVVPEDGLFNSLRQAVGKLEGWK